jgi:hypothetical protein
LGDRLQQIGPVDELLHQILIVRLLEVGQQCRDLGMGSQCSSRIASCRNSSRARCELSTD